MRLKRSSHGRAARFSRLQARHMPHAKCLATATSHSSRPSIGMLQVVIARPTPVGRAMDHRVYLGDWTSRTPHYARIEDLLTERPTLAIPRLCHNAKADLLRNQQVLGSKPSVGSTPPFRAQQEQLSGDSTVFCRLPAHEDLLTEHTPRTPASRYARPTARVAGCSPASGSKTCCPGLSC
jgi:hypothetical protein